MRKYLIIHMIIVLFSGMLIQSHAQNNSFNEVDKLLRDADSLNAVMLSPENYSRGLQQYNEAKTAMMERESVSEINEKIVNSKNFLDKAIKNAELAQKTFKDLLNARKDCMSVNAATEARDDWEKGQELFETTMNDFESNDVDDAKENSLEAEKYFRQAELTAIKNKYLKNAEDLIAAADEKDIGERAPVTLSKAKLLLHEAEEALTDKRYNNQKAKELVYNAIYETKHATYISSLIQKMQEEDKTWEDLVVESEIPLSTIADKYDLSVKYDEGFQDAVNKISKFIDSKNSEIESLNKQLTALNKKLDQKNKTADSLLVALQNLESKHEAVESKLGVIETEREEYRKVEEMFNITEAEVKKEGNRILIRLISLNFEAGKSIIDPQYFALLSKVEKAINIFKGSMVTIEGHTDSQGSDKKNLTLSRERAEAVTKYLLANIEIEPNKLLAVGKGETEPIANNETEEGRRKNRRIDIYISTY